MSPIGGACAEKSVRWGIVGAGRIAQRFARSLAREPRSELVAISCRNAAKAAAFAATHGVGEDGTLSDEALGSVAGSAHAALLARPDVDAVYVALPPALHLEWSLAALRAGKAVLCEKPLCASLEETVLLARAARSENLLLMEATKTRFEPLYLRVRELVENGAIGRLTRVETGLCSDMGERVASGADYMSDPVGGGNLLDSGIYCAAWLTDYLTEPIEVLGARARWVRGVDTFTDAELRAGDVSARLVTACDQGNPREAVLVGTEGRIVVEEMHRPQRARLERAGEKPVELEAPYPVDDLYAEIEHFVGLLLAGKTESPVMPLATSLRCAELLAAVRARMGSGPQPSPAV